MSEGNTGYDNESGKPKTFIKIVKEYKRRIFSAGRSIDKMPEPLGMSTKGPSGSLDANIESARRAVEDFRNRENPVQPSQPPQEPEK